MDPSLSLAPPSYPSVHRDALNPNPTETQQSFARSIGEKLGVRMQIMQESHELDKKKLQLYERKVIALERIADALAFAPDGPEGSEIIKKGNAQMEKMKEEEQNKKRKLRYEVTFGSKIRDPLPEEELNIVDNDNVATWPSPKCPKCKCESEYIYCNCSVDQH